MNKKIEMEFIQKFNLLETNKKEAGQIINFLVGLHEIKQENIDFRK